MEEKKKVDITEKEIKKAKGGMALILVLLGFAVDIAVFITAIVLLAGGISEAGGGILLVLSMLFMVIMIILSTGFHVINPNEAMVFTLFGKYYGTIKKQGFYYLNPFASAINPAGKTWVSTQANGNVSVSSAGTKKISTKVMTLNNEKQKVNDVLGNPIIIGAVVIWRVKDPTSAVFQVENYKKYLSTQCDSTIRNIARLYPYDVMDEGETEEKTLRGSSQEIAENMTGELQERVKDAGLEIIEVRITHLSYAEEIAAAMLQRQQAVAIIAARKKIVEGAVSMVKMAIDELGEEEIVVLDEERKAAMVSNLLVVLCGNKDAQPIVNSGSIY
ncbi:MAG: SPFH domain-containing protein [Lachnospiraceae bacterium]|nr:SPFH domain-containing protein [Lachnospiraceae bacterium]